jgi:selenide, water dikinase
MGPGDLSAALAPLPRDTDARLLVGRETFDDAGVYALSEDLALVQTVDFFAPIVDDPYLFGQVAAANALSDVYAMGGEPMTAMSIVAFPTGKLPLHVLTEILRGGQDKVHEAGAVLVGGHSVVDDEVKFGLSVTGRVHPGRLLTNAGARVGDRLVLTKPIGTGVLATAAKRGDLDPALHREMVATMVALNAGASREAVALGGRCATDVTGFGLLGHASHVARASGVTLRLVATQVPLLGGARDAWVRGNRTGGAERNAAYLAPLVHWRNASVDEPLRALMIDPQTSGGLLVALPPSAAERYLRQVSGSVDVGEVLLPGAAAIVVD